MATDVSSPILPSHLGHLLGNIEIPLEQRNAFVAVSQSIQDPATRIEIFEEAARLNNHSPLYLATLMAELCRQRHLRTQDIQWVNQRAYWLTKAFQLDPVPQIKIFRSITDEAAGLDERQASAHVYGALRSVTQGSLVEALLQLMCLRHVLKGAQNVRTHILTEIGRWIALKGVRQYLPVAQTMNELTTGPEASLGIAEKEQVLLGAGSALAQHASSAHPLLVARVNFEHLSLARSRMSADVYDKAAQQNALLSDKYGTTAADFHQALAQFIAQEPVVVS